MNTAQLQELNQLLETQIGLYHKVESGMEQKRRILLEGRSDALPDLDQQLNALAHKATELEQRRLTLLSEAGYENRTLQDVIARLPGKAQSVMGDKRQRLRRLLQNIQELNRENDSLLELSIRWVADTVDLVARAMVPEASSYNRQGGANALMNGDGNGAIRPSTIERNA